MLFIFFTFNGNLGLANRTFKIVELSGKGVEPLSANNAVDFCSRSACYGVPSLIIPSDRLFHTLSHPYRGNLLCFRHLEIDNLGRHPPSVTVHGLFTALCQ